MRPKKKVLKGKYSKSAAKITYEGRRKAEAHNRQRDITKSISGVDIGKKEVPEYNENAIKDRHLRRAKKAEKLYKRAGSSYEKAAKTEDRKKHDKLIKKGAKQATRANRKGKMGGERLEKRVDKGLAKGLTKKIRQPLGTRTRRKRS